MAANKTPEKSSRGGAAEIKKPRFIMSRGIGKRTNFRCELLVQIFQELLRGSCRLLSLLLRRSLLFYEERMSRPPNLDDFLLVDSSERKFQPLDLEIVYPISILLFVLFLLYSILDSC